MKRLALLALILFCRLISPDGLAQVPQISSGGVVNAASYALGSPLAPGVIFSIFGSNLTDGSTAWATSLPLPTRLAGATVLVNGLVAPLFYGSPSQINAHLPVETAGNTAIIQVQVQRSGSITSTQTTVELRRLSPGIITLDGNGTGPGAILRNRDFSKICPPGRNDCPANPAVRGEVIDIFATGLGQVNEPLGSPRVMIGGIEATVLFSGLVPEFVGLYQVNAVVPPNIPGGTAVPVVIHFGAFDTSNIVTVAIEGTSLEQPPAGPVYALAIDPGNPSTVYAGAFGGGVFKTTNGAANWTDVNRGLMNPFVRTLAVDPVHPATVYAGTVGGGVFKSTNGGMNWTSINSGLFNSIVYALAVDPVNPSMVYAGTSGGGAYKSTNGGASWSSILGDWYNDTVVSALAIDPANPATLYAAAESGVSKSTNGGTTWVKTGGLNDKAIVALVLDPTNPSTLYAAAAFGNGGVFKSTDAGASWTTINSGLTTNDIRSLAIDPVNPSTIYIGTETGVFKSTNSGASWTGLLGGPCRVGALAIDPSRSSTLYASSNYRAGVSKSTDSGATWQPTDSGAGCWDY